MNPLTDPGYLERFFPRSGDGEDQIALAFYFGFYFPDGYLAETRRRVLDVCRAYWRLCGGELKWMTRPVACTWRSVPDGYDIDAWERELAVASYRKFAPGSAAAGTRAIDGEHPPGESEAAWLSSFASRDWMWSMIFHSGRGRSEAGAYQILGLGNAVQRRRYSYLYLFVPPHWFAERDEHPLMRYLEWSAMLGARHGTAGLGIVPAEDEAIRGRTAGLARSLAAQCPGLEICDPLGQCGVAWGGLLSPNWLSMIDDDLIESLGGPSALTERIAGASPDGAVRLHRFDGGAVLSAGEHPALYEDQTPGVPPEAYKVVAGLLKPIRSTRAWGFWGAADGGADWLGRFDS